MEKMNLPIHPNNDMGTMFNPDKMDNVVAELEITSGQLNDCIEDTERKIEKATQQRDDFESSMSLEVGATKDQNKVTDSQYDAEFEAASLPGRRKMLEGLKNNVEKLQADKKLLLEKQAELKQKIDFWKQNIQTDTKKPPQNFNLN
ncbi:MAG: hypothetical protein KA028_00415 [Candidatus Pacebacteria bacterium]|nr:hypothetical protein [Candidatus Paceibacterota bacterium]MBP9851967.1 hypothetical protein [Candidatus Paceibacterota bacterium]